MAIFEIRTDDRVLVGIEQTEDSAKATALEIEGQGKRCMISVMGLGQSLMSPACAPNTVIKWDRELSGWVYSNV